MQYLHHIDVNLLNWFHNNLIPGSVPVLQAISDYATYVSIMMILTVLVMAWGKKSRAIAIKFTVLLMVLVVVVAGTRGLKATFDRDRPFTTYPEIEKLSSGGDSSFPSGHTFEVFAMATAIVYLFRKRKIAIPVFLWAALVAYTRIALGVHYPSDILAGILFGVLTGLVVPWGYYKLVVRLPAKPAG